MIAKFDDLVEVLCEMNYKYYYFIDETGFNTAEKKSTPQLAAMPHNSRAQTTDSIHSVFRRFRTECRID